MNAMVGIHSASLSARRQRFVDHYCVHHNASRAAREAGYAATSGADAVTGHRLLRNAKTKAAIQARQQAHAVDLEITRQDVIAAILGAIQMARMQAAPSTMVRGWCEVARILGFYNAQSVATVPPKASRKLLELQKYFDSLDDAALLAIAENRQPPAPSAER